ncbi:MAG TPA: glycosyltransferase [Ignavibacteriales bacterium]|nr:glycosyltransferase [Ignavibacteriales bacterium]
MYVDLSIVIVNYNVKEFLINSIESIYKASSSINIEIIVVDNNSTDGSVEALQKNFPEVKIIANKFNAGFAKANNQGIEIAIGRYILLLNPDTLVQENTFTTLIKFMDENTNVGMCGCKILNPDGSLQLACRRSYPSLWVAFTKIVGLSSLFPKSKLFGKYNLTYLDENKTYEVEAISGSFMFVRREVMDIVRELDEDFFMYGEDLDFCYRIKQAGYKIYYVHETSIIHYKGESTKRSNIDEIKHFYGAMQIFVKKHYKFNIILMMLLNFAIKIRSLFAFFYKFKFSFLQIIIDNLLISFSIYLAEKLYLVNKLGWEGFPPENKPYVYIIPAFFFNFIAFLLSSYKNNKIFLFKKNVALILNFLMLSAFTFFFKEYGFSRVATVLSFLFSLIFINAFGILLKFIHYQSTPNFTKIAIIGTNDLSLELIEKLKSNIKHIYDIQGFITLNTDELYKKILNYSVIGTIENIEKVIDEYQLEKIVITPNVLSYEQILKLLTICKNRVEFLLATNTLDYLVGKNNSHIINEIELLKLDYAYLKVSNIFLKYLFEKVIVVMMVLLFPVLYPLKNKVFDNIYKNLFDIFSDKVNIIGFNPKNKELKLGKSGLFGLWSLNERETNNEALKNYDILYAKNYSLWLDLQILFKNIKAKN